MSTGNAMEQGRLKVIASRFRTLIFIVASSTTLNPTAVPKNLDRSKSSYLVDSQLQSTQVQAAQITKTIASLNSQILQLSESYDFTQTKLAQLKQKRTALQSKLDSAKR